MSSSTNFYTQLHEAAPNVDISLRIKEKNGRYTVMFQPETANNNTLRGLNVTGTPAELDAGFFEKVLDAMLAFRNDEYLWWQVAELTYDSYLVRNRTRT